MKNGIQIVADERNRQIQEEGYSIAEDSEYEENELLKAANCYLNAREYIKDAQSLNQMPPDWPFPRSSWKPVPDDRIKELAKAAALIIAHIDVLLLLEERKNIVQLLEKRLGNRTAVTVEREEFYKLLNLIKSEI